MDASYDNVTVGGGASGIVVASSLKTRKPGLETAIFDPAHAHYYQPSWIIVGGGVFAAEDSVRNRIRFFWMDIVS
ncbi:MAG: hypothetical protein R8G34_13445 [Paracoccaceae bacterium]|nr:hypothetical protein [Paracoccaceae bacterium]